MQFTNVTCPHCGLLCDDLSVQVDDGQVDLSSPLNDHCSSAFQDACLTNKHPSPTISGKTATLEQAISKAAEILTQASLPIVNGLIADVQACRAAVALTEKVSGVIDHANGKNIRPNVAVMQRMGKVKTTLAEARNRADNIIIFGSAVLDRFPRLVDRILQPEQSLGSDQTLHKTITILDVKGTQPSAQINKHSSINHIQLQLDSLDSVIQSFQNIVQNSSVTNTDTSETDKVLIRLRDQIYEKNYSVIIWSTSLLAPDAAEHSIQSITHAIKNMMTEVRCVGMPLGGSKGEITASQVVTWQTGVPLPVAFMSGVPQHDPTLYDGAHMIAQQEVDAMLWLSTYRPTDTPPECSIPTVVIGHPNMQCEHADVFIPVGIPGIDTRGLACRTDSVATLPLLKIRDIALPHASDVIEKINQKITY